MLVPAVKDIEQVIKRPEQLLTVGEYTTVTEAATKMRDNHVGCLMVVDAQGRFIGVLTERDMLAKVLTTHQAQNRIPVRDIMTSDVISCDAETAITEVEQLMAEHKIRHVPIVEKGTLIGMVSSRDIIAYRLHSNTAMKAAAEQLAMLSTGLKSLDFDDVVALTINETPKAFGAERAVLCFPQQGDSDAMIYRKDCRLSEKELLDPEEIGRLLKSEQVVCGKVCRECEKLGGQTPRLVIPLSIHDQCNGNGHTNTHRQGFLCMCRFDPASVSLEEPQLYKASLLQEVLNANLTNARLYQNYQKARRDSETDPLTGVGTRRVLEQVLKTEYARAVRYDSCFSIAIVDIDKFKDINDTAGHAAGDKALKQLAKLMRNNTRTTDIIIARYGGDEFVMVMPETDLKGAKILLERLRRQVKTISIPRISSITISCGLAEWDRAIDDSSQSILKRADSALYEAKRTGRNRVITSQPTVNTA